MKSKIKDFYKNLTDDNITNAYYHPQKICEILNLNYHELRKSDIKELEKFRYNFIKEHKEDITQAYLKGKYERLIKREKIELANKVKQFIR